MKYIYLSLFISLSSYAWDSQKFKKPAAGELKKTLSSLQYNVTQEEGTERPFSNPFHDKKEPGVYVDVVSGEPLFSSLDKYDSGTGWPSFKKTIRDGAVMTKTDTSLYGERTEVRSKYADSHLGHVFNDGPAPLGKRFCMNSASLRFIPKDKLAAEGYGEFVGLFK